MTSSHADLPRVAVVGGGLAGLAAAVALRGAGCRVSLYEARRQLGGRAASFSDPETGGWVDHCQHVSMGCCTNLADFCRRTQIGDLFRRDPVLHFIGPDLNRYDVRPSRWLPPPLHLAPALMRLRYLTVMDRVRIAGGLWRLLRMSSTEAHDLPPVQQWLRSLGQSEAAIERFWAVILVSALGESLERASVVAARKVLVDGFMAARAACEIEVPRVPLSEVYGERLNSWLRDHGVQVHLGTAVQALEHSGNQQWRIVIAGLEPVHSDCVVAAVTWRRIAELLPLETSVKLPWLPRLSEIHAAPITAVHLWFDRSITQLPHAVIVGRLSQWLFSRGEDSTADSAACHYYQVVISASHNLSGRDRDDVVREVCEDLGAIWPQARGARLLRARVVTDPIAVPSIGPTVERLRPSQETGVPGLFVAGDWTATGWPATMEGAVRSGYLAAEAILKLSGHARKVLVPDLPRSWLARVLVRN